MAQISRKKDDPLMRRILSLVFLTAFGLALAGCGDTWNGFKEDTGQNTAAAGKTIQNTGDKIEDSAE
jgi:predicted small secreted protein